MHDHQRAIRPMQQSSTRGAQQHAGEATAPTAAHDDELATLGLLDEVTNRPAGPGRRPHARKPRGNAHPTRPDSRRAQPAPAATADHAVSMSSLRRAKAVARLKSDHAWTATSSAPRNDASSKATPIAGSLCGIHRHRRAPDRPGSIRPWPEDRGSRRRDSSCEYPLRTHRSQQSPGELAQAARAEDDHPRYATVPASEISVPPRRVGY